ncbi:MAG: dienelactone hydrolase family protein, partial [Nitrospirales bacterium]
MAEHATTFTLDEIGSTTVRFSSSGIFSTHKDHMVDPYVSTRTPKEAQIEGTQYTPQTGGVFPSLVMLHDRWGLTSHIHALAKQIACEGYIVLVPNLYGRLGGMITANDEVAEALMSRLDEKHAINDINACCEYLNTNIPEDALLDNAKRNMHGVIGFGMGGGLAIQFTARRRRLRAAVSFYGHIPENSHEIAKAQYCPILYHAAGLNESSSTDDITKFQEQAQEEGKKVEIRSYPDTPQG